MVVVESFPLQHITCLLFFFFYLEKTQFRYLTRHLNNLTIGIVTLHQFFTFFFKSTLSKYCVKTQDVLALSVPLEVFLSSLQDTFRIHLCLQKQFFF